MRRSGPEDVHLLARCHLMAREAAASTRDADSPAGTWWDTASCASGHGTRVRTITQTAALSIAARTTSAQGVPPSPSLQTVSMRNVQYYGFPRAPAQGSGSGTPIPELPGGPLPASQRPQGTLPGGKFGRPAMVSRVSPKALSPTLAN